jgi:hypothetical protein
VYVRHRGGSFRTDAAARFSFSPRGHLVTPTSDQKLVGERNNSTIDIFVWIRRDSHFPCMSRVHRGSRWISC